VYHGLLFKNIEVNGQFYAVGGGCFITHYDYGRPDVFTGYFGPDIPDGERADGIWIMGDRDHDGVIGTVDDATGTFYVDPGDDSYFYDNIEIDGALGAGDLLPARQDGTAYQQFPPINVFSEIYHGDADKDGDVDLDDFITLKSNFATTGARYEDGDFDFDRDVDLDDFEVLKDNFGKITAWHANDPVGATVDGIDAVGSVEDQPTSDVAEGDEAPSRRLLIRLESIPGWKRD
jgi:hypothetical protein